MSNRLPNDLINHLKDDPNFNYEAFVAVHDTEEKTSSIRFNPSKKGSYKELHVDRPIAWCQDAFFLKERPVFTLDPLFHAGVYYSQEASSMFIDHIVHSQGLHQQAVKALDLCAAPGGKSTLLNSVLHPDSLLLANEIIKSRVVVLNDNLVKWGNANVVVTNNDPSAFGRLPGYFDLMVVDAPCSGSGMFHKDHQAIDEWSLANVKLCAERQKRILAETAKCLKQDGVLIYSTCSYSRDENEDIVDWLIDEFEFESVAVPVQQEWNIDLTHSAKNAAVGYRFYPHLVDGEGFFCAVLKKKNAEPSFSMKKLKVEKNAAPQQLAKDWMHMDGLYCFQHKDMLHAFPKQYELDLVALKQVLYLKNAGTVVGKIMGKDLIPSHDLALSNHIRDDIQSITFEKEDALNFLRKENLSPDLNPDGFKGWVLIKYEGVNLGWIKAMPNRINNYFPKEIRIANL